MIRALAEIACIAAVMAGFYLAWPPLAFIVGGFTGLLWLGISGGRNDADSTG